jgi:hypothetical protein
VRVHDEQLVHPRRDACVPGGQRNRFHDLRFIHVKDRDLLLIRKQKEPVATTAPDDGVGHRAWEFDLGRVLFKRSRFDRHRARGREREFRAGRVRRIGIWRGWFDRWLFGDVNDRRNDLWNLAPVGMGRILLGWLLSGLVTGRVELWFGSVFGFRYSLGLRALPLLVIRVSFNPLWRVSLLEYAGDKQPACREPNCADGEGTKHHLAQKSRSMCGCGSPVPRSLPLWLFLGCGVVKCAVWVGECPLTDGTLSLFPHLRCRNIDHSTTGRAIVEERHGR